MDNAFQYVKAHGVSSLSNYPYTARDGRCTHQQNSGNIKLTGFHDVASNEAALKQAVGE